MCAEPFAARYADTGRIRVHVLGVGRVADQRVEFGEETCVEIKRVGVHDFDHL